MLNFSRRIKNVETKTYIIDGNGAKQVRNFRKNRRIADMLFQQLLEEGLVYRSADPTMKESKRKLKRSSKYPRQVPHLFDEIQHDRKFNHPGNRGDRGDQLVIEPSEEESDELAILEKIEDKSVEKQPEQKTEKKNCYNNVYQNVLEAFQDALKQQIKSYKNCVCNKKKPHPNALKSDEEGEMKNQSSLEGPKIDFGPENQQIPPPTHRGSKHEHEHKMHEAEDGSHRNGENRPSKSPKHRSHHKHAEESASSPITNQIATTTAPITEHPFKYRTEMPSKIDLNLVPEVSNSPEDEEYICFHRKSAVLLTELLHTLQNGASSSYDNMASPSLRKNRLHFGGNVRSVQEVSSLEFDRSADVERFEIPIDTTLRPTTVSTTLKQTTVETPNEMDKEHEKLMALFELIKVLQDGSDQADIYKKIMTTTASTLLPRMKETNPKQYINEVSKNSYENSGSENSASQEQMENLEEQLQNFKNMFQTELSRNSKSFQKPSASRHSVSKAERKPASNSRRVRHNGDSSYEIAKPSEAEIDQPTRTSKHSSKHRSQYRPSGYSKASSDYGKKLSLAVEIPKLSRGIVRKIKYELE